MQSPVTGGKGAWLTWQDSLSLISKGGSLDEHLLQCIISASKVHYIFWNKWWLHCLNPVLIPAPCPFINFSHLSEVSVGLKMQWSIPKYHRILGWLGLKGTLKTTQFQPPAMVRDTFHQIVFLLCSGDLQWQGLSRERLSLFRMLCSASAPRGVCWRGLLVLLVISVYWWANVQEKKGEARPLSEAASPNFSCVQFLQKSPFQKEGWVSQVFLWYKIAWNVFLFSHSIVYKLTWNSLKSLYLTS